MINDHKLEYNKHKKNWTLIYFGTGQPLRYSGGRSQCNYMLFDWRLRYGPGASGEPVIYPEYADMDAKDDSEPSAQLTMAEYHKLVRERLDTLVEVLKNKGADYTAGDDNPFANFDVTAKLGLSDAKTGVLIRMVDKIQRIKSFIINGKLAVKNEGAEDAVMDIMGYSLVLMGMLENDRRRLSKNNNISK